MTLHPNVVYTMYRIRRTGTPNRYRVAGLSTDGTVVPGCLCPGAHGTPDEAMHCERWLGMRQLPKWDGPSRGYVDVAADPVLSVDWPTPPEKEETMPSFDGKPREVREGVWSGALGEMRPDPEAQAAFDACLARESSASLAAEPEAPNATIDEVTSSADDTVTLPDGNT